MSGDRWAPKPEKYDEEESWVGWMQRAKPAFEAGEFPRSSVAEDWLPSEQQFDRAISKSRRELSEKASEEGSCLGQELEDLSFSWRTVGISQKRRFVPSTWGCELLGQSLVVGLCGEPSPATLVAVGWQEANDSGSSGGPLVVGVLGIVCWR